MYSENQFISSDGQYFRTMSAQQSHSGDYVCVARNELGAAQKKFNVEVHGETLSSKMADSLLTENLLSRISSLVALGFLERMQYAMWSWYTNPIKDLLTIERKAFSPKP